MKTVRELIFLLWSIVVYVVSKVFCLIMKINTMFLKMIIKILQVWERRIKCHNEFNQK